MKLYRIFTRHEANIAVWSTADNENDFLNHVQYIIDNTNQPGAFYVLTAENTPDGPKVDEVPLTEAAAAYGIRKRSFYERLNA